MTDKSVGEDATVYMTTEKDLVTEGQAGQSNTKLPQMLCTSEEFI